jgi:hypothetical protein
MKYNLILLSFIVSCSIFAQQKIESKNTIRKNGIVLSPLSLFEPNATFDIGYIYSINSKHKVFIDAGLLLPFNFYKGELPFTKGGRILSQYRKYNSKNNFFYGLELRYRNVIFSNRGAQFVNTITRDTSFFKNPTAVSNTTAWAVIIGSQLNVTENKKWALDFTFGLGVRKKTIRYKETTSTFFPYENEFQSRRNYLYPAKDQPIETVHITGTIRLIYFL